MSDLIAEVAETKKELLAMKAGFSGTAKMFTGATVTQSSFTLTPTRGMLITVDFEYRNVPEIAITGIKLSPPVGVFVGFGIRRSLYEWYIEYEPAFGTIRWDCVLFSENPPSSFTLVEVS